MSKALRLRGVSWSDSVRATVRMRTAATTRALREDAAWLSDLLKAILVKHLSYDLEQLELGKAADDYVTMAQQGQKAM